MASIQDGYLNLDHVDFQLPQGEPTPDPQIPIPAGRWITPTHWQSNGDTLDLFRGQQVEYLLDQKTITYTNALRMTHGVVLKVDAHMIQLAVYDGTHGLPKTWQNKVGEETFHITPYSHLERPLKPGDRVLVDWFGEPGDKIIWGTEQTILGE